jgi:prepilin-type processing-associated H-X9-DG protein
MARAYLQILISSQYQCDTFFATSHSYVINEYIALDIEDAIRDIDGLKATSQTIMVFEGADERDPRVFETEHAHPSNWFKPLYVSRGWTWGFLNKEIAPSRHNGVSHYLFADGHVAAIPEGRIKGWADEGYNFAKPDAANVNRR